MYEVSREPLNEFAPNSQEDLSVLARTSLNVNVKGRQGHRGQKRHFSALSAACVRFICGKTYLASSYGRPM